MHSTLRGPTTLLLSALLFVTSPMTGCKSSKDATPTAAQNEQTQTQAAPLSLDDLVAPIALYPDQLLAQVLIASTTPQEVLDGGNWIIQNQHLKGDALTNAARTAGFGPSMQYLMSFPQVVDNMCQEMDWTTQLGQAYQADQKGVMEAVQRKRSEAQKAGNLVSSPQMTVETKADKGQQYVEIKPADPKVVYVPQYNPVTIYNVQAAPAPAPTPTTTQSSGVSTEKAVGIGLLSFGVGMLVGSAISNNNNYYPYPAWGYHGVYYGGRPYYRPPYRPAYPGYYPASGYRPPPNYQWNQVNKNVNVNINQNYYNQFNKQNRPSTLPANNLYAGNPSGNPSNRPGQGNNAYQGARPATTNQKPGSSMANAIPSNQQLGNRANQPANMNRPSANNGAAASNRMGNAGTANTRPNTGIAGSMNRGSASPTTQPMNRGGDRGYGEANASRPSRGNAGTANTRPSTGNTGSMNRGGASPTTQPTNRGGDRGYGETNASRPSPTPQTQNRGSGGAAAFGGGSAKADRSASSRGQSSMGARPASTGGSRKPR
jgi:Protein of unknown function (DUF3300)